jgi:hypothetical protein
VLQLLKNAMTCVKGICKKLVWLGAVFQLHGNAGN